MSWFYLSFSSEGHWRVGAIMQAADFTAACNSAFEQGIAGAEVAGCEIPAEHTEGLEQWAGRLLTRQELQQALKAELVSFADLLETDCARYCPNYRSEDDGCNGDCDIEMNFRVKSWRVN